MYHWLRGITLFSNEKFLFLTTLGFVRILISDNIFSDETIVTINLHCHFIFLPGLFETDTSLLGGIGLRIVIHPQGSMPNIREEGQSSLLPPAREGYVFTGVCQSFCSRSASRLIGHSSSLLVRDRYASYWNAFLFHLILCRYFLILIKCKYYATNKLTTLKFDGTAQFV